MEEIYIVLDPEQGWNSVIGAFTILEDARDHAKSVGPQCYIHTEPLKN